MSILYSDQMCTGCFMLYCSFNNIIFHVDFNYIILYSDAHIISDAQSIIYYINYIIICQYDIHILDVRVFL